MNGREPTVETQGDESAGHAAGEATHDAAAYRARGQYFGDVAQGYDAQRRRTLYDRWKWRREHAAVARALAALAPAASILDLPTGTGRFLPQLGAASSGATVGADISLDMLRLAGTRTTASDGHATRVGLLAAEAERLPFADDAFDLVVSIRFFQHLPAEAVAPIIAELNRVSRRGVLAQVPLRHPLSPAVRALSRLLHRLTGGRAGSPVRRAGARYFPTGRGELDGLLAGLGLEVRSSRVVTWWGGQLRLLHVVDE